MTPTSESQAKLNVEFHPQERVTRVPPGVSIFNAANWIGLAIDSTCGGMGTCGKCRVRVTTGAGAVTAADRKVFSPEELADGWRLSCRAAVETDTVCQVPRLMGNPKAALMGFGRHVLLNPNVHKVCLALTPPSLEDQRSDYQRIVTALDEEGFEVSAGLAVRRQLPRVLRAADWRVTAVVVGQQLVAVEPGDTRARSFGVAFDVGTTTVVGMLINLTNGAPVAVRSVLNGQASFGADVIARISHVMLSDTGLDELAARIAGSFNEVLRELLAEGEVAPEEVYEMVVAGNATMTHLLLGITPEAIGVEPFIPAVDDLLQVSAAQLGLNLHPEAPVVVLPHIGAYVGADLVAGLLATGLHQKPGVRLLVDVGTNGEIILGSEARTLCTAAPAGPAFEGARIQDGMRAATGAIETVTFVDDEVQVQTIDQAPPVGICGSGLLDIVAQLRLAGLVDGSGQLATPEKAARVAGPGLARRVVVGADGVKAFVLVEAEASGTGKAIRLTQRDIRELQFAKGAIAGGIAVLMRELGVTAGDLEEIYLAGSFGSYINPQSARLLGLVPPVPVERIKAVGNSAGEGARIALLSFREREVARSIPLLVEYHELSGRADFNDAFIEVLRFPEPGELAMEAVC
jgi:uncharacterized 2Fe-2S/4Fe-4S cluster protein (DUF4445 family)